MLIVSSPTPRIESPQECDLLIERFEKLYEKIYARAAKYPDAGYLVMEAGVRVSVEKLKPKLRVNPLGPPKPNKESLKGHREAFFNGKVLKTAVYELENLLPGNEVSGPCIIEHPTTTMVVPPEHSVFLDEYKTLWLRK